MNTLIKVAIMLGVAVVAGFAIIGLERIDAGHIGIKVNLIGTMPSDDFARVYFSRFWAGIRTHARTHIQTDRHTHTHEKKKPP